MMIQSAPQLKGLGIDPATADDVQRTVPDLAHPNGDTMMNKLTQPKSKSSGKRQRTADAKRSVLKTPPLERLLSSGGKLLPKVIAFTNQKGGVGKSTCSVHMQDWLIRQGLKVLLIDADAQQCSSPWASELGHPFEIISEPDALFNRLVELRVDEQYDVIVVDGPGSASETTKTILNCVDLALIPIKESFFDVVSTGKILDYVRQSQFVRGGSPKAALFFSNVDERTLAYRDAKTSIAQCQVVLLETAIYQRACITDSPGQAQTVFSINRKEPRESAARFEQLFLEAMEIYNA